MPRLSGIFPWGNSNVTVEYTAYLHYILLQFDLSYSQLCLVGEKVDMAWHSQSEKRQILQPIRAIFLSMLPLIFIPLLSPREISLLMYRRRNWGGDAFLRQFITRAGSWNLFEHLIYHSWNVNWYLKMLYHDYFWLERNG